MKRTLSTLINQISEQLIDSSEYIGTIEDIRSEFLIIPQIYRPEHKYVPTIIFKMTEDLFTAYTDLDSKKFERIAEQIVDINQRWLMRIDYVLKRYFDLSILIEASFDPFKHPAARFVQNSIFFTLDSFKKKVKYYDDHKLKDFWVVTRYCSDDSDSKTFDRNHGYYLDKVVHGLTNEEVIEKYGLNSYANFITRILKSHCKKYNLPRPAR